MLGWWCGDDIGSGVDYDGDVMSSVIFCWCCLLRHLWWQLLCLCSVVVILTGAWLPVGICRCCVSAHQLVSTVPSPSRVGSSSWNIMFQTFFMFEVIYCTYVLMQFSPFCKHCQTAYLVVFNSHFTASINWTVEQSVSMNDWEMMILSSVCLIGLYLDAEAALDYIFTRSDINQQKLVVFGRSLGGAVAIRTCSVPYYASRVACLVVENTFTSIPEMAHTLFDVRLLSYIPDWCYKNKVWSSSTGLKSCCVW